ncbi:MAG: hypothetical protein ACKPJJ_26415, partial [Planctomycetaceae bacterium]
MRVTSLPGLASAGVREISKVTSPARADLPKPMAGVRVCCDGLAAAASVVVAAASLLRGVSLLAVVA